jgi:hypothetical protein
LCFLGFLGFFLGLCPVVVVVRRVLVGLVVVDELDGVVVVSVDVEDDDVEPVVVVDEVDVVVEEEDELECVVVEVVDEVVVDVVDVVVVVVVDVVQYSAGSVQYS